jgi:hypothetical protein
MRSIIICEMTHSSKIIYEECGMNMICYYGLLNNVICKWWKLKWNYFKFISYANKLQIHFK